MILNRRKKEEKIILNEEKKKAIENYKFHTNLRKLSQLHYKKPKHDSYLSLENINKIYDNYVQAVFDFSLQIEEKEFIVLVGPSGCGKSTALRMVAGLESITSGELFIDSEYANDLLPRERDFAMVFQNYALYPHLTVAQNIEFPLKIRKKLTQSLDESGSPITDIDQKKVKRLSLQLKHVENYLNELNRRKAKLGVKFSEDNEIALAQQDIKDLKSKIDEVSSKKVKLYEYKRYTKQERKDRVIEIAEILELSNLLDRKPRQLSGGQSQRVALGRAISRNAKLFLMDEPLSNLDAKLRVQMRAEILKLHKFLGSTTIYVTHDQTEAMTMASRIVIMNKGRILQIGKPIDVYNNPNCLFVASFIGSPSINTLAAAIKSNIGVIDNDEFKISEDYLPFFKKRLEEETNLLKEIDDNFSERKKLYDALIHNEADNQRSIIQSKISHLENAHTKRVETIKRIDEYASSIKNDNFNIVVGIRPEDIYLDNANIKDDYLKLEVTVDFIELLGKEYIIHTIYNSIEIILKSEVNDKIVQGNKIDIYLDLNKIHLFDKISELVIS